MSDVYLINWTLNPEKIIALAAKTCYSEENILDIDMSDDEIPKFIQLLFRMNHLSPFEHVNYTFGIECSRACSHQIVRHKVGCSYSQKSQRYVEEKQFKYYIPSTIKNSIFKDEYISMMETIQKFYDKMKGIPKEDRRFILPNACRTQLVTTINARELLHIFNVRCCNRSQWEFRGIARKMLYLLRQISPNIFKNAGPNCFTSGLCPEGKMTCGKIEEVKNLFKNDDLLYCSINELEINCDK